MDNIEIAANYSDSSDPKSMYVEELLRDPDELDDFGSRIAPLGAKYVVLFKTADYEAYDFVKEQGGLEEVFEGPTVALYRNLRPSTSGFAIDESKFLESKGD